MNTTDNSIHVLLIEDNPGDVRLIREMLQEAKGRKIVLEHCTTLTQGLQALSKNDFNILILDLTLPDSIGFDTFVKVYTQNPQIPIIVLTGTNDEELAIKSVRTGAQDYLIKGQIDSSLLSRSISYAIERAGLLRIVQQELIERKAMESTLRKINRALRVLSECNEIVVRATEENVLGEKICGAITAVGEYQFAWIVFMERNDTKSIRPIAISGSKDCHFQEEASMWFKRDINSPLSEAIQTGKVVVCDDVTVDKRCSNLKTEADKLGYRSFAVLPLVAGESILGVVQICSKEPYRFDQEELKLLEELKEDIAYAIVSIRTQKERQRADEELRENEEKFRVLFEQLPIGVSLLDKNRKVMQVNPALEKILGISKDDLLQEKHQTQRYIRSDGTTMPPEEFASARAFKEQKLVRDIETGVITESGKTIWTSVSATPFPMADKGLLIVTADITERKRAEQELIIANKELVFQNEEKEKRAAELIITNKELVFQNEERKQAEEKLRESETRYRSVLQSATDAIVTVDSSGMVIGWNSAAERIFGYSYTEAVGQSLTSIVSLYAFDEHTNGMKGLQSKEGQDVVGKTREFKGFRKDKSVFPIELSLSSWETKSGQFFTGIIRDITERKRAEQETLVLARFPAENPNPVLRVEKDGKIIYANHASESLLHNWNCTVGEYLPSDWREKVVNVVRHSISTTADVEYEDRFYSMMVVAIPDAGYVNIYGRDITEHKRAEEKNRQLEQQLIQAQKLESLGTLASGIAHDFNNILGIILAYSSLLGKIKMGSEKYSESLNAITNAVQRGAALVRQILTFARKTDILFEPISLLELVHELLSMLNQTFPKTIIFRENIEKDIPYISADRTQIYQALLNLYVNARDAMPNGGCITLTIEKRTGEQIREQFHNVNQDLYLCVSVTDTGEGMDETIRSRIFDPFFTTKEKGKGTGLGLSVVFGVVHAHHGFIDVDSEPGKGTTFQLYLPASQTVEPIRAEEGQTIIEEILGGTETLLVIEDEKALSELVRHLLEAKGYKVHTAQDGNEAIEVYKRYKEEIDIVLTDMGLPGMIGAEVFKKLKEINPNVSVIFCSGSNESDIISELYKAGVKGFIKKPYNPNELLRKVRDVLDEK